jgi:hypothetical protein
VAKKGPKRAVGGTLVTPLEELWLQCLLSLCLHDPRRVMVSVRLQNAADDVVAHDGSYSTPRVHAPAGKPSTWTTQMADAVNSKQTRPDRETTPKKSPGSQSLQSPGVLVTEETACVQGDAVQSLTNFTEETACVQGDAGQSLMEQFGALGRAFEPEHAAGAGSTGRHREMFDHKQRSPCHQQVRARARTGAGARVRARPSAMAGAGPGLGQG